MFGSLSRLYQELKQDYGQVIVERQSADLNARARKYHNAPAGGSLRLNPGLPIPRYQTAADLHCMPGSYHTDRGDDDVWAGAVYDPGVYYFAMGALGPYNEDMGVAMCRWLAENFPKLNPRRILDMGCTVGHSTTPYALAFPDAEIHAIDVAAPVLRYAHARAQSMGFGINFSQQDAERTNFDDASFDLVVSHILLHETSRRAVFNIMKESRRLLRSGGLAIHIEAPIQNDQLTPLDAFSQDWATHYNAEPFWTRRRRFLAAVQVSRVAGLGS
jgi:SAM-dependent methyltransferase